MRLLWFTDTLGDVNGVSRFIRNMADEAPRRGRDLIVITSSAVPVPSRANIVNIAPVMSCRMPGYAHLEIVLPPARRLLRRARELRPDAIHASTPGPVGLVALMAAKRLRVPLVATYHTDFPSYVDHLFDDAALTAACRWTMRAFYSRAAMVLARSPGFVEPIAALGIPRDRIHTIDAGIDLAEFSPEYRDEATWHRLGSHGAPMRALYVGRVSVEKNLPLLARAWRMVRSMPDMPPAELVIVGDGPYLPRMRRELHGGAARFLGFRHGAELSAIYASADLFVFPSLTDTLGQSVMEAQASGLPAIVSAEGGPRTIVREGETGVVVASARERDWAEAMATLLRDAGRRRRMGSAAAAMMATRGIARSFEHFWELCERAATSRAERRRPAAPAPLP